MKKLYTLALSVALVGMVAGNAFAQNSNSGNGNQSVSNTSSSVSSTVDAAFDLDAIGSGNNGNLGSAINSFNAIDSGNFDSETNSFTSVDVDTDFNTGVSQSLDDSSIGSQSNDFSTGDRFNLSSTVSGSFNTGIYDNDVTTLTTSNNGNTTWTTNITDGSTTTTTTTWDTNIVNDYKNNVMGNGNASFDNVGVGVNGVGAAALFGEAGANINNSQNYLMTGDNLNQNIINPAPAAP